ncbi:MAG: cadmium-translocating P-type ATPase [Clostridiales bacterium]|nr:cadmium-translocating P-type ATPase [Candidatus Equinaster intestinalis]
MDKEQKLSVIKIIASLGLTAAGYILKANGGNFFLYLPLFIIAAIIAGYEVLIEAAEGVIHGHILDENFLMCVGAIGAFILGSYSEGTVILILFGIGELAEDLATDKSKDAISELVGLKAEYVNLYDNGIITKADPNTVQVGSEICISAGDKVPIDCIVLSGASEVSTAALTGESMPKYVETGDTLLAGFINIGGDLICKTVKSCENSAVANILNLVQNEQNKKSQTESFVTHFAKYYTPIVVSLALLIFVIPSLISGEFAKWGYRAISFLVVSCPCALVVSVPLAFFGAIGGASKKGILIKGSKYLELLSKTDTAVFDKTGTLTKGSFEVTEIIPENCDKQTLIKMAAICEYRSTHPIALSIKKEFNAEAFADRINDFAAIPGKGAVCSFSGKTLLAGSAKLMEEYGISYTPINKIGTQVYIAFDGNYYGALVINDTIKDNCRESIEAIQKLGIKTAILTGDNAETAEQIAKQAGIENVYAELLPQDKVQKMNEIKKAGITAYIGDGINDAPVLIASDIGFSMGKLGSDAAIEASSVVLMSDNLALIEKAIKLSRKAMRIAKENIAASLLIKFAVLLLSVFGISNIYMAVFADVGVLILAVFNSLRTLIK